MKTLPTLMIVAALAAPHGVRALPMAQIAPDAPSDETAVVCQSLRTERAALLERRQELQAQLGGAVQGVEQNARAGQAMANGANALGWATGVASLVPGVGYAASAASAAATQQAAMQQQRNTAARTQDVQSAVQQLAPIGQRLHVLETEIQARGCP